MGACTSSARAQCVFSLFAGASCLVLFYCISSIVLNSEFPQTVPPTVVSYSSDARVQTYQTHTVVFAQVMSDNLTKWNWQRILFTPVDEQVQLSKRRFKCDGCMKQYTYRPDSMMRHCALQCDGLSAAQKAQMKDMWKERQGKMRSTNQFKAKKRSIRELSASESDCNDVGFDSKRSKTIDSVSDAHKSKSMSSTLLIDTDSDSENGSVSLKQITLSGRPGLTHMQVQQWKAKFARAIILGGRPNALADDKYLRHALEFLTIGELRPHKHLSRNSVFKDYLGPLHSAIKNRVEQVCVLFMFVLYIHRICVYM